MRPWTLYLPDGGKVTGLGDQADTVFDRNGNFISILRYTSPSGNPQTEIVDQAGRSVTMESIFSSGVRVQDIIRRKAFGDAQDLTWNVFWSARSTATSAYYYCTSDDQTCSGYQTLQVVERIELPQMIPGEALVYAFDYSDAGENGWGELNSVTLPGREGLTPTRVTYTYRDENAVKVLPNLIGNPVTSKTLGFAERYDGTETGRIETSQYVFTNAMSQFTGPDGSVTRHSLFDPANLSDPQRGLVYKIERPRGEVIERIWRRSLP